MTATLTAEEHLIIDLASSLAGEVRRWLGDGPAAAGDWAEVASAIHVIQRMVMSQAAVRAYPDKFRHVGGPK